MLGDLKFHEHKTIDASVARRWQDDLIATRELGEAARRLASSFGYSTASSLPETTQAARTLAASVQSPSPFDPESAKCRPSNPNQEPTASAILLKPGELKPGEHCSANGPIPASLTQLAPLTYPQLMQWYLQQLEPGTSTYNISAQLRLTGPLNPGVLQRSLDELVCRQGSLRTGFSLHEGQPRQFVVPDIRCVIPTVDIGGLTPRSKQEEAEKVCKAVRAVPFDLARAPLIRTILIKMTETEHIFMVMAHHIVCDAWSFTIFLSELGTLYTAFSRQEPSPIAPLPIQYADYAVWRMKSAAGELTQSDLSYWKSNLAGAPISVDLPLDHDRADVHDLRGAWKSLQIPPTLVEKVDLISRRHLVTHFTVMLAALNILLFRWTGQRDLVIGTVTANRWRSEIQDIIGCFIDVVPLRSKVKPQMTAAELLQQIRTRYVEALAHHDCSIGDIIAAVRPERQFARSPLFNVVFVMQNASQTVSFGPNLEVMRDRPEGQMSLVFDLRFVVRSVESSDGWTLICDYRPGAFDDETIEQIIENYHAILLDMVERTDSSLTAFGISPQLADGSAPSPTALAIAATFTAEPVESALKLLLAELGIEADIEFAPYNQVFQELLNPDSLLSKNAGGINFLLIRIEDWLRDDPRRHDDNELAEWERQRLRDCSKEFVAAVRSSAANSGIPHVVIMCEGASLALAHLNRLDRFREFEEAIFGELHALSDIYAIRSTDISEYYPMADYYNPFGERQSHIPFTDSMYAAIGTMIARMSYSITSDPYKVIAVDCDGTLWNGVLGEDGVEGVRITNDNAWLQTFLIQQQEAGMVLCLCSKNNEQDVWELFDRRPEMRLTRAHIAAWRLNWEPKSQNIESLCQELGLAADSVIFIDDSPAECAEVEANCPEVLVLQLPPDGEMQPVMRNIWAFDHFKVSDEASHRTQMYRANRIREEVRQQAPSFEEYLRSLELAVTTSVVDKDSASRAAELTQRTNQMNLTTKRRKAIEIERLTKTEGKTCEIIEVKDRFGEYGKVGLLIYKTAGPRLEVDTFLLSCRVLGRGVEAHLIRRLGEIGQREGTNSIVLEYQESKKNQVAKQLLDRLAGQYRETTDGGALYTLPVDFAAGISPIGGNQ
ncbi:MAG TPA: HAD-IIIC family phosphatase [Blastocatellia bacterium]|nr:HAD-IIIC family phosphatase [Blastocatellia bacterium]